MPVRSTSEEQLSDAAYSHNGQSSAASQGNETPVDANHNQLQWQDASSMSGGAVINGYDAPVAEKLAFNDDSFTERAVDVPPDFKGSRKEPPKWPASGTRNGNSESDSTNAASQRDRSASNRSGGDDILDSRVRFHETELQRRREAEERMARERELLRDSLRGSAKLRSLANNGSRKHSKSSQGDVSLSGIVNVAYDGDAERQNLQNYGRERASDRQRSPAESQSQFDGALDSLAIDRLLQDIQSQLWSPGPSQVDSALKDELVAVQQLLRSDSTRRLLATCELLTRCKQRMDLAPPACPNAAAIADDTEDLLNYLAENRALPQRVRQDAAALVELLGSPTLASLLLAHDKLANAYLTNASAFGLAFLDNAPESRKVDSSRNGSISSQASRKRSLLVAPAMSSSASSRSEIEKARLDPPDEHVYVDAESNPRGIGVANVAFLDDDDDQRAFSEPNDSAKLRFDDSTEVQVVKLNRNADEPLGATIRNEGNGALIIGRILKGGLVERSGQLHEGDELLEVNSIDMRGRTVNDAYDIISDMRGTLTFIVAPNKEYAMPPTRKSQFFLRALFEYNAADDPYVPCRELGVEFKRGDVLCVLNDDDPNWWQARIVQQNGRSVPVSDDQLPFLIPSPTFYRERERLRRQIAKESEERNKDSSLCSCFRRKKRRKTAMFTELAADANLPDVLTYDDVVVYYPQPNRKRPIVLVGAERVGRSELRERLLKSDSDRFSGAVPHTSRVPQGSEKDGADFQFISRQAFEREIEAGRFIEFGEFERNLYGTSIDSVRTVINNGKVCVLALHSESLRVLDETDLKPFVVFVAPPDLERLRTLRSQQSPGVRVTDEELKAIIESSRQMDLQYGHYFDWALTFVSAEEAFKDLLAQINRLEVEPQYIPSRWVRATSTYGTLPADVNLRPPATAELSSRDASHYENVQVFSLSHAT